MISKQMIKELNDKAVLSDDRAYIYAEIDNHTVKSCSTTAYLQSLFLLSVILKETANQNNISTDTALWDLVNMLNLQDNTIE